MNPSSGVLKPEEETAFLQSTENVQLAAVRQLSTHNDEASVVAFVQKAQQAVDRVIGAVANRGAHIDCKAGCSHCCSARVEAIAPEIFQIARELELRPAAELTETVDRLQAHIAAPGQENAAWGHRKSCPFLARNLCSIYEVRPAACRKAHSLDVSKCEAHAPEIPQNLEIVLDAEALLRGTSGAYRQRGFDASGHELVRAVLVALLDPSAQARWYRGEQVFELAELVGRGRSERAS